MIFIGIGANLPSDRFGKPQATCDAARVALDRITGVRVVACSEWFESAPVPLSDQPWYINGVVKVETDLTPRNLLQAMHAIEADFGRVRTERNAPRILDLDLLAYNETLIVGSGPEIPHPRLVERAFVLRPLAQIAPNWVHPVTGESVSKMIAKLPKDQVCRPLNKKI
ncbi:MAG: 2-amino-4-hydroxy-6-hydroxymethyldihydropteridine diphosphokinase [Magnetovibrio sp.]|nr:2-amino-4-hydroxy-6-hydroxymethyldihydropteridine diphosphokinase [Magnetovibrio sp.]